MYAASRAADEAVAFLLSKGANPEIMDKVEMTALAHAILSGSPSTVSILAPVTRKSLDEAIKFLAIKDTELTPEVSDLLRRENTGKWLHIAATYGATGMVNILTECWMRNALPPVVAEKCIDPDQCHLLKHALMSDNAASVETILNHTSSICSTNICFALKRGNSDVINLLGMGEDEKTIEANKLQLKEDIMDRAAKVADRIPKCVEFHYDSEMVKLRPLLSRQAVVPYKDLLSALHIPPVHVEGVCPRDCKQREHCDKLRQVYYLVRLLFENMGKINLVFKLGPNRHPSIIGSMKEHTRVFFTN